MQPNVRLIGNTDLVYLEKTEHDNVLEPDGEVHEAVGRAKGRCLSGF
jgi:hypothetical protein